MKIDSVYKEALKVTFVVFILGVIEFILFTVFMGLRIDVFFGVLYGCTFASANFFYLARSVKKCVDRDEIRQSLYEWNLFNTYASYCGDDNCCGKGGTHLFLGGNYSLVVTKSCDSCCKSSVLV